MHSCLKAVSTATLSCRALSFSLGCGCMSIIWYIMTFDFEAQVCACLFQSLARRILCWLKYCAKKSAIKTKEKSSGGIIIVTLLTFSLGHSVSHQCPAANSSPSSVQPAVVKKAAMMRVLMTWQLNWNKYVLSISVILARCIQAPVDFTSSPLDDFFFMFILCDDLGSSWLLAAWLPGFYFFTK